MGQSHAEVAIELAAIESRIARPLCRSRIILGRYRHHIRARAAHARAQIEYRRRKLCPAAAALPREMVRLTLTTCAARPPAFDYADYRSSKRVRTGRTTGLVSDDADLVAITRKAQHRLH